MISLLVSWGLPKAIATGLVYLFAASVGYALYQTAADMKQEYDERLTKIGKLESEIAGVKANEDAMIAESEDRWRSVMAADRQREIALAETRRTQQALKGRVDENVKLQKRVKELELLVNMQVVQPVEFTGPTLDGGERKVDDDFTPEPPIDVSDLEFDGSLRLLHDQALASCANPGAQNLALGPAGRSDQAPLSVGEFVETVIANYCIAAETRSQLERAQRWAAMNCAGLPVPVKQGD